MYTVLIIDDELQPRENLASMLRENFPHYQILDTCSSANEGVAKIKTLNPQLIFLDVLMPPRTGFDVLEQVGLLNFETIFITSYEKYALKALKLSAVDFLLKPYSVSDLRVSLEKFETRFKLKSSHENVAILMENLKRSSAEKMQIALPTQKGFVFVQIENIVRCNSDNMYTTFFFLDKTKLMVTRSLKDCSEMLVEMGFYRIHASHLINMRYMKGYTRGEGGQVEMIDGSILNVSRRNKEEFLSLLKRV